MNCLIDSWKTVVNQGLDYLLITLSWRMSFTYSVTFKTETKTNIPSLKQFRLNRAYRFLGSDFILLLYIMTSLRFRILQTPYVQETAWRGK